MSVIAHWIEQLGIHTVVIGLVRLHLEKIQPPRALWVPFELGRPLGAPSDTAFQTAVLTQALSMIENDNDRPVIIDYPDDDPRSVNDLQWQPPATGAATTVAEELAALQPAFLKYREERGRTATGVAKIPIGEAAELVDSLSDATPRHSARDDVSPLLMARLAIDDLKACYLEAALASTLAGTRPSSEQVYGWLWQDTVLGQKLRTLRTQWMQSDNPKLAALGERSLVPRRWLED